MKKKGFSVIESAAVFIEIIAMCCRQSTKIKFFFSVGQNGVVITCIYRYITCYRGVFCTYIIYIQLQELFKSSTAFVLYVRIRYTDVLYIINVRLNIRTPCRRHSNSTSVFFSFFFKRSTS